MSNAQLHNHNIDIQKFTFVFTPFLFFQLHASYMGYAQYGT